MQKTGALNQTTNEKRRVAFSTEPRGRKRRSGGAVRERTYLMGPPTEEGEEARTTTKSPPHRHAQPIFHHKRRTWTAIASRNSCPLLRRVLILVQNKCDGLPIVQNTYMGSSCHDPAALAPVPCKENIRAHAHAHILVTSPNLDRIGHRTAKVRRPRVALHARSHTHAGVYRE